MTDAATIRGERPRLAVVRNLRNAGWFAVATVCFGAFMGPLDAGIGALTFPALHHEFGGPLAAVQWVSPAALIGLAVLAGLAGVGLAVREPRPTSPLVELRVVRPRPVSLGLLGALAGYLVLVGPLALFPQVLADGRTTGLLLTCLPAGLGVAAIGATRVLRRRCGAGVRMLEAA